MKGMILQSVAKPPLILGVPQELFFIMGGVLALSLASGFPLTGFIAVAMVYIASFMAATKDPYFVKAYIALLNQPTPVSASSTSLWSYFERNYSA